ncbi:hypothetical protein ACMZ29_16415 [Brevibacterium casei]|uniref:hypothetical protein n=1 Tax=Brevibacterium casei TaxID=33889 RepID=UPI0039EE61E3
MDADSLRARIADIIGQNCEADGYTKLSTAQAVIDDLGLTVEDRLTEYGIDDPGYESRVVGKWEAEK